jgi:nucleoredoxin
MLQILFVSADDSQQVFDKYFADMPWCAIPFEERDVKKALEKRLEITGYPTLLMLGPRPADDEDNFGDRPIINTDVRAVIENGDYISDFPYYPKPWGDLCQSTDDINTHKCLIVFHELGDDQQQEAVEDAVKQAAEDYRGDELIKFYWANDQGAPLAANVRETCAALGMRAEPTMVLLDIPEDGAYYLSDETDITPETIKWFLLNKGDRLQI